MKAITIPFICHLVVQFASIMWQAVVCRMPPYTLAQNVQLYSYYPKYLSDLPTVILQQRYIYIYILLNSAEYLSKIVGCVCFRHFEYSVKYLSRICAQAGFDSLEQSRTEPYRH